MSPNPLARFFNHDDQNRAEAIPGTNSTTPARIIENLLERGNQVTAVTYAPGQHGLRLNGDNLTFVQIPSERRARARALTFWRAERTTMESELRRANPEVVHAHWTYEHALAALSSDLPTVITIHDAPLTVVRHTPNAYRALRLMLAYQVRMRQSQARFTAVSPYAAEAWRRQMLTRVPIRIIPNSPPPPNYEPYGQKTGHPTIIDVADSGRRKNIPLLLNVFSQIRTSYPNAELILIGNGLGETDPIARQAAASGKAAGVRFLGHQSGHSVQSFMRGSWVHAHVSLEETFGNTIVEAMATGTAVLAGKDSGAPPWLLDEGRAGCLTDVTSSHDVHEALQFLLESAERRDSYAAIALKRASDKFAPEVTTSAYISEYKMAISQSTSVRR